MFSPPPPTHHHDFYPSRRVHQLAQLGAMFCADLVVTETCTAHTGTDALSLSIFFPYAWHDFFSMGMTLLPIVFSDFSSLRPSS
jgi:hypothetical protein